MGRPFHMCHCGDHGFSALTKGFVVLVDPADVCQISTLSWAAKIGGRTAYAIASKQRLGGSRFMHRILIGTPTEMLTDHINGNGLDNRRSNLRLCTTSQSRMNQVRLRRDKRGSRFKGVWPIAAGVWAAGIKYQGKNRHLGFFADEREAARAYDRGALALFGEFARPNFAAA